VKRGSIAVLTLVCVGMVSGVFADGVRNWRARLTGFEETPLTLSTVASGRFDARINREETAVDWELRYEDLEGAVLQAHIHFGDRHIGGGISVFLCSNLGNGPAGTQPCPPAPARISGTFMAADVLGPAGQGIEPGALAELIRAIRAGRTYANVHSSKWPSGEIRGQLGRDSGRGNDHSGH
jgi:hypothetical protein